MPIQADKPASRAILITACSGVFIEHYLDLLDSLQDVGLTSRFDLGLIDLGMNAGQRDMLAARGVRIVPATWPIEPPAAQNALHLIAFAGKPFARDYFPGYEIYGWMDADMWAQTPDFWDALEQGVREHGAAVPIEVDAGYGAMSWDNRIWKFRHFLRGFGLRQVWGLSRQPMLNNGLFAMAADAPQWAMWQARFRQMVRASQRTLAIDQLSLMAAHYLDDFPLALVDAGNNWVCSLGTPDYDIERKRFVKPGTSGDVISVLHITTPSRAQVSDSLQ